MSFRLYVYYCALSGALGAFAGWALGRLLAAEAGGAVAAQGIKALCLGAAVALALGLVDAAANLSLRRAVLRVGTAVLGGAAGGLVGGVVSQLLFDRGGLTVFLVLGWALTGLLIGAALGGFDLLAGLARGQDAGGAARKVRNGALGGAAGGLAGGALAVALREAFAGVFVVESDELLWSPSAWGFVALGGCIGLLIGLAQVLLKDAWLYVERGFRKGRELMLTRPETTVGRAEGCDLGLFGDPGVDRLHARIVRRGGRFVLESAGAAPTYVNGEPLRGPRALESGDEIRLGQSVLRFRERARPRMKGEG